MISKYDTVEPSVVSTGSLQVTIICNNEPFKVDLLDAHFLDLVCFDVKKKKILSFVLFNLRAFLLM